jgi:hypothetical protein
MTTTRPINMRLDAKTVVGPLHKREEREREREREAVISVLLSLQQGNEKYDPHLKSRGFIGVKPQDTVRLRTATITASPDVWVLSKIIQEVIDCPRSQRQFHPKPS